MLKNNEGLVAVARATLAGKGRKCQETLGDTPGAMEFTYPNDYTEGMVVFAGSSGDNALRTRNVLSQGGYVQLVLIDGYHGSKITDKGTSFLRYLMGQ